MPLYWKYLLFYSLQINVREYRRGNQKGQSRGTGNIGYTSRRKSKQKHDTICVVHRYTQTNTNRITQQDMSPHTNNWR
jgi:hypothetical protein